MNVLNATEQYPKTWLTWRILCCVYFATVQKILPKREVIKKAKQKVTGCYEGWEEATNSDWISREGLIGKIPAEWRTCV